MKEDYIKRILHRIFRGGYYSAEDYILFLRKKGIQVGENCSIYDPNKVSIDTQNPYMLEIGNNVRITAGVQILTHDYSFCVLTAVDGGIVGSVEKTVIGNNVFIGRNAIILKGVHIGDNVIIGAGSVVTRDCESNGVYAGNPAKLICSIDEMYRKNKNKELENAKDLALTYYNKNKKIPDETVLREYMTLFMRRDSIPYELDLLMRDSGVYELCLEKYRYSEPQFNGINEFLAWCGIPIKESINE